MASQLESCQEQDGQVAALNLSRTGARWRRYGLVIGACALVAVPSFAEPKKSPSLEKLGGLRLELSPTAATLGLRGILQDGALVFWSCGEGEPLRSCAALPPPAVYKAAGQPSRVLSVAMEQRWLSGPVEVRRETLREGALLHLVIGGSDRSYHLVVVPGLRRDYAAKEPLGARPSAERALPAVALKGALAKEEHELVRTSQGEFEFVRRARACGRQDDPLVAVENHRVELGSQAFVDVADLPEPVATRAEPTPLQVRPKTSVGLGLAVEAGPGSSDAARDSWGFGLGAALPSPSAEVFSFLAPSESLVRLKLRESSGQFWLQSKAGTSKLQLEEGAGVEWEVRLPASPDGEPACVTLHADRLAAVVGVSLVAERLEDLRTADLVPKLGGENSRSYELALLASAGEASRALTKGYDSLSDKGRERAFRVIQNLPDKLDVEPLLRVLVAADARSAEAREHLKKFDLSALGPVMENWFWQSSLRDEVKIAEAYASLDPEHAARAIVGKIARELRDVRGKRGKVVRTRRASLRVVLAHTLSQMADPRASQGSREGAVRSIEGLLAHPDTEPGVRVELLRALPDSLESEAILAAFVDSAREFPSAYVLLEPRLGRFARLSKTGQDELRSGAPLGHSFARLESAAYDTRLLELLMEKELPEGTRAFFRAQIELGLQSKERRVRERAADVFANQPLSFSLNESGRKKLLDSVYGDPWLEVRAASAIALGRQLGELEVAPDKETSEAKLAKLGRKSRDVILVRALMKALGASGGPAAREALLDILDDEDALYDARAGAADSLGRLCEARALPSLQRYALSLGAKPTASGQVDLGLASVRALRRISPDQAEARLRPLMSPEVPGPIRAEVAGLLEGPSCGLLAP